MGAEEFYVAVHSTTAKKAFDVAVADAQEEHGHGGYTGTIAEKSSFVMIEDTGAEVRQRYAAAVAGYGAVTKWLNSVPANEYDADEVERRIWGVERAAKICMQFVPGRAKSATLKELRTTVKGLRAMRDSVNSHTKPLQLAELLVAAEDPRIDDKWGPAGCIDVTPNNKKKKQFLFFGTASS